MENTIFVRRSDRLQSKSRIDYTEEAVLSDYTEEEEVLSDYEELSKLYTRQEYKIRALYKKIGFYKNFATNDVNLVRTPHSYVPSEPKSLHRTPTIGLGLEGSNAGTFLIMNLFTFTQAFYLVMGVVATASSMSILNSNS
jgi:hypothetical protein